MTIRLLMSLFLTTLFLSAYAQNGVLVGPTSGSAHASAMLEVNSTSKGFLLPRVNLVALNNGTSPINTPAPGLLVYNLGGGGVAAVGIYYWDGSANAWVQLTAGGMSGSGTTDYVARWTSSTSLGVGTIRDDGTNVGIGVAPGTYKVNIQGGSLNVGTMYGSSVMYGTLGSFDTRSTNPWPETYYMGVTSEFKGNSTIGLTDGGSYNSVLSLRQWSSGADWSGGGVHQLAFTPNGNMWNRYSETTGAWGPWKKILTQNVVFHCTGADQTWQCPTGVTSITVKMWGAGGGAGSYGGWNCGYTGGGGGFTTGRIAVTPGTTYYIVVGLGGQGGTASQLSTCYGGGGRSCTSSDCRYCGGGGGRSAFRNSANNADLMTAGGGGGGGATSGNNQYLHRGGAGGGATGQNGENQYNGAGYHGYGGTQSAGGAGGAGASRVGIAGSQYQGGYPGGAESYGGGGGGGWYGGGGGSYHSYMSGGGGGSGYISGAGVSAATTTTGNFDIPAGVSDPNYLPGVGVGGRGSGGGNGMVVIIY
jgi:hypothetical protein